MRRPFALLSTLALLPFLAACPPGDDTGATGEPAVSDTASVQATQPGQPPMETITITLSGTSVSVDRDSVTVARSQSPVIRWRSDPAGGNWIVGFGEPDTPFQNGQRVFFGGSQNQGDRQGTIPQQATLGAYKYWVFYADSEGNYHQLDPKLVIIEDPGATSDTVP